MRDEPSPSEFPKTIAASRLIAGIRGPRTGFVPGVRAGRAKYVWRSSNSQPHLSSGMEREFPPSAATVRSTRTGLFPGPSWVRSTMAMVSVAAHCRGPEVVSKMGFPTPQQNRTQGHTKVHALEES